MPRYRLDIEYDGTPFFGWQVQSHGPSVQGAIIDAIGRFCGKQVLLQGAGRTDSGVHALAQVAHFDLTTPRDPTVIRDALNNLLRPDPVAILSASSVSDDFDARFSATARHYLYRILNRRAPSALERTRVWWVPRALDAAAMAEAAPVLLGHHDFTTFRATACQAKSPVKTLDRLDVVRHGAEIHITASARSFMHSQVRSLAGSLKLVGEGRWTAQDLAAALEARDRAACGPVAPACGLYLTGVDYAAGIGVEPPLL